MPIVFYGIKQFTIDGKADKSVAAQCGQCGQATVFTPATKLTFIHIFGIPLVPIWFTRAVRCSRCRTLFKRN